MCTAIPARGRALTAGEVALVIAQWRAQLAISCVVRHEPISRFQVTGPDGRPGAALVGVVVEPERQVATIYHTRRLTTEDIVHELLHVAHPGWSEQRVVSETGRLLQPHAVSAGASKAPALGAPHLVSGLPVTLSWLRVSLAADALRPALDPIHR